MADRWTVTRRGDQRPAWAPVYRDDLAALSRLVSSTAVVVWVCIATYADRSGTNAWPMQRTIGARLGLSMRTVNRCVRELRQAGALVVQTRETSRGRRTVYTVVYGVGREPGDEPD